MWTACFGETVPDAIAPVYGETFRPLTPQEFEKIRRMAYETFGLDLKPGKQALVSARLGKQLRGAGFRTFEQYVRHVEQDSTGQALIAMVDALTTNFTSFLREPAHFNFLTGTIWAGFRVLATDISTRALAVARAGIYTKDKVQPVGHMAGKYFVHCKADDSFQVRPEVRNLVDFGRANLVEGKLPAGPFHVVFCRNVMIYFDKPTQERVVNRLAGCIEPGGYLFIGHSESLTGIRHPFTYVQPAIYRRPADGSGRTGTGRGLSGWRIA